VEDHHVVHPVQELGAEVAVQLPLDPLLHLSQAALSMAGPGLQDVLAPDVRGHDDDRVPEVHGAPLGVGEAAVVQDLEEDVEDLGWAFSISSKRITAWGRRRTASVSCPPSS
jgi:hypothetical protein